MAKYSPKEFLYARPIANELVVSGTFRNWFLAGTRFEKLAKTARPLIEEQERLRTTANSKRWFWFNYWCPRDASCECRGEKGIETDILLIFEAEGRARFAVHVEIKLPQDTFLPGQAESYPRRGRCWLTDTGRPRTVPPHTDFVTVLVCGENLTPDPRIECFDKIIQHRDVGKRIEPYPDVTDARNSQAGQP